MSESSKNHAKAFLLAGSLALASAFGAVQLMGQPIVTAASAAVVNPTAIGTTPTTPPVKQPLDVAVTVPASCTIAGRTYRASATSQAVQGYTVTFAVDVVGYTGPGAYTGAFTANVATPDGTVIVAPAVIRFPVSITATGGNATYHTVSTEGRDITLSLTWTC